MVPLCYEQMNITLLLTALLATLFSLTLAAPSASSASSVSSPSIRTEYVRIMERSPATLVFLTEEQTYLVENPAQRIKAVKSFLSRWDLEADFKSTSEDGTVMSQFWKAVHTHLCQNSSIHIDFEDQTEVDGAKFWDKIDEIAAVFVFGTGTISGAYLRFFLQYAKECKGSKHCLYSLAHPLYEAILKKLALLEAYEDPSKLNTTSFSSNESGIVPILRISGMVVLFLSACCSLAAYLLRRRGGDVPVIDQEKSSSEKSSM